MTALAYEVIKTNDLTVEFRIAVQSDEITSFTYNCEKVVIVGDKTMHKIIFESVANPEIIYATKETRLYLRGTDSRADQETLSVPLKIFDHILTASAYLVSYAYKKAIREVRYSRGLYSYEV